MKYLLILITVLGFQHTFGQQFKVVERSDLKLESQNSKFIFISEQTQLDQKTFVATFRVEGILKYMFPLYYQIKNKAQRFGANSFRFRSFRKLENGECELIIETYFNDDRVFEANALNIPRNKVFIFGKANIEDDKSQILKIDNEDRKITSGKYLEIVLSKEISIGKDGFTSKRLTIAPNAFENPIFLIVSGSRLSGATYSPNGLGFSFKAAGLEQLENDLGLLMLKIYEKS